jgi:hypothetical protein
VFSLTRDSGLQVRKQTCQKHCKNLGSLHVDIKLPLLPLKFIPPKSHSDHRYLLVTVATNNAPVSAFPSIECGSICSELSKLRLNVYFKPRSGVSSWKFSPVDTPFYANGTTANTTLLNRLLRTCVSTRFQSTTYIVL